MRICLAGAAPDTLNLGVSALCAATIAGLTQRLPNAKFVIFDKGDGVRTLSQSVGSTTVEVERRGLWGRRRVHRKENLATASALAVTGGLGSMLNGNLKRIDESDALLDISGGDSFSDIYGIKRFRNVMAPKRIANARRKPLILLPQTYGPFTSSKAARAASEVTKIADICFARDTHSYEILRDLLGSSFDPLRHREGVDVAFGLEPKPITHNLQPAVQDILASTRSHPLVGLNISGLIFNDPLASNQYRFLDEYSETVMSFLHRVLMETDAKVLIVPHVVLLDGVGSDPVASEAVFQRLPDDLKDRVAIGPANIDANEAKWIISQCDWFCGTRMHSTIAGLSSGTPTATINYSDKAKGVFESCGQGSQVFDPRELNRESIIAGLMDSLYRRAAIRDSLRKHLPAVLDRASEQLDFIADRIMAYQSITS